jgi:pimeloyl-ACP methyl ester carboxylesterase
MTTIEPSFRTIDGLNIRYADTGGSHPTTLLLTSPWPESIYAFARVWPTLADRARLVAIDLPGFGRSEGRDDVMSPRRMGAFLNRFVVEAELGRPHIVAPDVGTAAALFAASVQPGQIAGLVVGTGAASIPLQLGEPLKSGSWTEIWTSTASSTRPRSSTSRSTRSRAAFPTRSGRTTSRVTRETGSSSRWHTCGVIRRSCPSSPASCPV